MLNRQHIEFRFTVALEQEDTRIQRELKKQEENWGKL